MSSQIWASFHTALWVPLLLDQVVLGGWGLVLGFRRQAIGSAFYSALAVDELLLLLQSLTGALVLATDHGPQPIHFLYGGLLIGLLPVVYAYSNRRQRAGLWLGFTLLFMAGLIIRSYFTGRV